MDRNNKTHCNSPMTSKAEIGVTHAKRFEISLEQLAQLLESTDGEPLLRPIRREPTLGAELGVPGFQGEFVEAPSEFIPTGLDLDDLETLAHFAANQTKGAGRAGILICRTKSSDSDAESRIDPAVN